MAASSDTLQPTAARHLRLGIALFVLSWLPFPLLLLAILRALGFLQSDQAGTQFVVALWGLQYELGLVGLWLAGKESIAVVKQGGWRKLPAACWRALRYGSAD